MHFVNQRTHLPNDPQLEVDEGSVLEKTVEQRAARGQIQRSQASFGWVAGGENERRRQLGKGAGDLA